MGVMQKRIWLWLLVTVLISCNVNAQEWLNNLQKDVNIQESSFFDIQKAFDEFWEPYGIEDGYYIKDGKRTKAPGWKQFKRWEWFWESRVEIQNGAFPSNAELNLLRQSYPDRSLKSGLGETGNWSNLGPNSSTGGYAGIGRLNCVAFHPDNMTTIYVGAATGGLWKSLDSGSTWTVLGQENAVLGISDIVVIPNGTTETMYIATGDKNHWRNNFSVGVLKSLDGGQTWNATGLDWSQNENDWVARLLVDPNNNEILFAATSIGVYKTSNAGQDWTKLISGNYIDLEFKPDDSQILYASTKYNGSIIRTTNGGTDWTSQLDCDGNRTQIAVSPDNSNFVYSLVSTSSGSLFGLYKSTDAGESFTQIAGDSPNMLDYYSDGSGTEGQGWYDLCIAADPNDADKVFIGGVNTWKSSDGGTTWTTANMWTGGSTYNLNGTPVVHADKHFLAFQNGTSKLYECNDGGIYVTNDGTQWTDLSNGLVISQLYRLGVSQLIEGDLIAGLQDNGTKNRTSNVWNDVIGGDGMECIIDQDNSNIQYGSLQYGTVYKTMNNWSSKSEITSDIDEQGAWVTPYVLDPNNSSTLYIGFDEVYKSVDRGGSWTKLSSFEGNDLINLAVAPSNSDCIYTGTNRIIYRSTDGGSNWTNITSNLPVSNFYINNISVSQTDPDLVWVACGQFNSHGVYQTSDGGSTWVNISSGLPEIPINSIIQNKQNTEQQELYVGTDLGVYIKFDAVNWTLFSSGLPNVVVSEIEIRYNDDPSKSVLYAATYGRGIWKSLVSYGSEDAVVETIVASNITTSSAESGGNILSDGGSEITDRGVCWSTENSPTLENDHTSDGTGNGEFVSSLTGLEPGTTYNVRAFVTNGTGTFYGSQINFRTLGGGENRPTDWTINPSSFGYDGEITAQVLINDKIADSPDGILAAFVGAECRGVKETGLTSPNGEYVYILRCYSNVASGETVSFKYYDPTTDFIFDLYETVDFESNMTLGDALNPIELNVHRPDDWIVDPQSFEYDGEITAQVFVNGLVADHPSGILAAFVGNICQGSQESGLVSPSGDYIYILRCYSDQASGESLTFKYYDPLSDLTLILEESIEFEANMTIGNADSPTELNGFTTLSAERDLSQGWSWFSINILNADMSVANILSSLDLTDGDYIKNQTVSASFYDSYGWFGDLTELDVKETYLIKLANSGTISYSGNSVDLSTTVIPITTGWNWIGYLPLNPINITDALASINPSEGDYIKNQTVSALFYDSYGWFGELTELSPLDGYLLKSGKEATLTYPASGNQPLSLSMISNSGDINIDRNSIYAGMIKDFNPSEFEYSGQLTAEVYLDGNIVGKKGDLLISMIDGRLVGTSHPMIFPPRDSPVFNHLAFENSPQGRELEFYFYQASNDQWFKFEETMAFKSNMLEGDAYYPFRLEKASRITSKESLLQNVSQSISLFPNPVSDFATISIELLSEENIVLEFVDFQGRVVQEIAIGRLLRGMNHVDIDTSELPIGFYIIRQQNKPKLNCRLIKAR